MNDSAKVPATLAISELNNVIFLKGELDVAGTGSENPLVTTTL